MQVSCVHYLSCAAIATPDTATTATAGAAYRAPTVVAASLTADLFIRIRKRYQPRGLLAVV